jgi:RNA polymerase sigma-70 factor (ECF subfamily)
MTPAPDAIREHVLRFVARRVARPEDAEDITQEVMLRIVRHRDTLARVQRTDAWVQRVAANAIADHYRRAARRELPAGQAEDVPEPPARDDGNIIDLRRDLAACLAPLVQRLPASYRQAIELTELGGVSQVDAAAQAGLSISGMKARVQRARGHLRERLLECCHVELDRRRGVQEIQPRRGTCDTCGAERA